MNLIYSISSAPLDLNPHPVEAALFALRSPLSRRVRLAYEVGIGETIGSLPDQAVRLRRQGGRIGRRHRLPLWRSRKAPMHTWSIRDSSYPGRVRERLRSRAPKQIDGLGNPELLQGRILGILGSRALEAGVLLKVKGVLSGLCAKGEPERNLYFAGGWQSPMERECLEFLLAEEASVIYALPHNIRGFNSIEALGEALKAARLLVLSRESQNRPSRASNERRNRLVWAMSDALLVLHAPADSGTACMAAEALKAEVPVFLPKHPDHEHLFEAGAEVAAAETIVEYLR